MEINRSLQGLRAIAFVAIFISHAELGRFECLGVWGGSIFLVLSGFLLVSKYILHDKTVEFGFGFTWGKIKKLYPLHIATMLSAAVLEFYYTVFNPNKSIYKLLIDLLLHSALVQTWIPDSRWYRTLNGPAWYLCVCLFCYLVFPLIYSRIKKYKNSRTAVCWVISLFLLQIVIATIAFLFGNENRDGFFSIQWITYYCPISRLIDFAIGCNMGYIFVKSSQKIRKGRATIIEIACIVLIFISYFIYYSEGSLLGKEYIKYSLLFIPTTSLLIWITSKGIGAISKLLSSKILVYIGNLSSSLFLIHGVAIKYTKVIMFRLFSAGANKYIIAILAFALSFLAATIWTKIYNRGFFHKREVLKSGV